MLKTILPYSNTDSCTKTLANSRVNTLRDSSNLLKDYEKNKKFGGYLTLERSINHEVKITFNSRLPGKNLGDKAPEKRLLMLARELESQTKRLKDKLDSNKDLLSKLIKEYDKKPRPELWEKMATIRLENIEIEQTLYRTYSEYFTKDGQTPLGITNELQVKEIAEIVARIKSLNQQQKIDFTQGNRPIKFTNRASHTMIECAAIIDRDCKIKIRSTLTVPGRSEAIKKGIADYSTVFDNRVNQVFRDFKRYFGIEILYMHKWEPHKDGTLHKHIDWGCNNATDDQVRYIMKKLDQAWFSLLDDMGTTEPVARGNKAGCFPGVDMYQRSIADINNPRRKKYSHIQSWKDHKDDLLKLEKTCKHTKIRESSARYLSKYLAKSVRTNGRSSKKFYFPSRWWGYSKAVKEAVVKERIKVIIPIASADYDDLVTMLDQALSQLVQNQGVVYYHKQFWDIYSTLDKSKKRVNRKPWEIRPPNSLRVATGSRLIIYITPDQFENITELIRAIAAIADSLNRAGPTDFSKFHANRYYVPADHYQREA